MMECVIGMTGRAERTGLIGDATATDKKVKLGTPDGGEVEVQSDIGNETVRARCTEDDHMDMWPKGPSRTVNSETDESRHSRILE